jgi:peptidoglycan L-alanyl-D-glutamate endopeptidase CwlK
MTRAELQDRDAVRLAGAHPALRQAVHAVLDELADLGHPMTVTSAARTTEAQQALYAQGRTKPGPRVTALDGVKKRSKHQVGDDGFCRAVDCAFLDSHLQPVWRDSDPWALFGAKAQAKGLVWGGTWRTPDRPHVELP